MKIDLHRKSIDRGMVMSPVIFAILLALCLTGAESILVSGKASTKNLEQTNITLDIALFKRINLPGKFADCQEIQDAGHRINGVYKLHINGTVKEVGCFLSGAPAWTIFQARYKGDTDFNRRLVEYANGFGNVSGDHWLGLNTIRHLVELGNNQLQIVMQSWPPSQTVIATYGSFGIGTQDQGWPLSVGSYSGPVADDMSYSNGRVFYTSDVPDPNQCAVHQRGGWWFNYCSYAFFNGRYYRGGRYAPTSSFYDGIYWKDWLGYDYSLYSVTMAVGHR
ncbi:hypothetical protein RvY_04337 [Ramazzottius varieornatus]|uniref:Fibrinogen C-terminal domain-containing protein n=1 Tax=Ramazzottius varieornatus TaxID=947166 RepID=A0A1D1UY50_RAMVA|nr:hypothetical protein RvY_04337 [Ramazzottius varieornatus]